MDLDVEGLYNVHKLQGSHDINDQKRLIKLLHILSSENGWPVCASLLTGSSQLPSPDSLPEVQKSAVMFLCCRAIEDYLKSDSPVKEGEPRKFAEFILNWLKKFTSPEGDHRLPKYLEAKASQLICLAILRYYPHHWGSLFDDLILLLTGISGESITHCSPALVAVDVFLDTLLNLDAYLVSRDLQLTTEEVAKSNEIKDSLRTSSIASLMGTCYQLINHLLSSGMIPSTHIKKILRTVGLYAAWVDLNLVAGAEWVTLLNRLLQLSTNTIDGPVIRTGVYAYLTGIVNKGMPAIDKLVLINGIWDQLGSLLLVDTTNPNFTDSNDETELDDALIESLCGLATLIDAMGLQLIDVYRILHESGTPVVPVSMASVSTTGDSDSLMNLTLGSMEARLNVAIHLFQHKEQQVGHLLVPFLRAYLSLLKSSGTPGSSGVSQSVSGRRSRNRNSSTSLDSGSFNCNTTNGASGLANVLELTESRIFLLKRLLFAFIDQLKSLPLYSPTETGEDEYEEYRHDLRTLIGNVIQLDAGFVLGMIFEMVKHSVQTISEIRQSTSNQSDANSDRLGEIDATLNLFYLFGETCKAPKNDHFAPTFPWNTVMSDIMQILCSDAFLNLPHWVLQLQYFEIMARYDHYFALASEHLFQIMVSFIDHRGLHSPWRDIRKRCPYLIARLVKTHRKTLAPHAEELLSLFSDLLPLCLEPDLTNGFAHDSTQINGAPIGNRAQTNGSTNAPLGIIEQGFLYEAAAQLIAASSGSDENTDRVGHLSRALLNPVLLQYHQLVEKYAGEKDSKLAEARGNLVRQAADLITRTIRVFYQPKSTMVFGSQGIVLDALNLMVEDLARFPTEAASPGRAASCAGVRAFLHRMIASSTPSPSGDSSDFLLTALIRAVPQLVKPLQTSQCVLPNQGIWSTNNILDAEQRWKEIRDIVPLFVQVISRYKAQSITFLSACLPGLFIAIGNALAEPLPVDHPTLAEERKLLRRGYLQLVQNIGQFLPQAFFELLGPNIVDSLSSVLEQTEACIEADDPLGLRSSLMLFCQLIQTTALDPCFYREFLLLKFVPFCVISPTRTTFRLSDAQFGLALNELAVCLHHLARLQDGFVTYLRDFYLPQQQLSPELIQSYTVALKSSNVKDFQTFIRNFYAAFR